MALSEESSVCEGVLRGYLECADRGASTELCSHTELSVTEVSNWLAGRRGLPAHKLVGALDWLVREGRVTITVNT